MIEELDASVGRVIQTLKRMGADKNSLVIFERRNLAAERPQLLQQMLDDLAPESSPSSQ